MAMVRIGKDIPLIGCIGFGVIDRGTNLLQVRASSACNLNCKFCSTDAGLFSKFHPVNYIVDKDHLVDWIKRAVEYKDVDDVEINFDTVGEPLTYPGFVDLVKEVSKIKGVYRISMQTNGILMTPGLFKKLEKYMTRINLSIHSLDFEKAKELSGCDSYDLKQILDLIKLISKSKVELLIAPVWMKGVNDEDIEKLIEFCKKNNARLGVQKYEKYRYGRRFKSVKLINFWKFYRQLAEWEKKFGVKLKLNRDDFKFRKVKRVPVIFSKGAVVRGEVVFDGWIKGQKVIRVLSKDWFDSRVISVIDCDNRVGDVIKVKILENKNEIYVAKKV